MRLGTNDGQKINRPMSKRRGLGGDLSRALDQARKERIQAELDRIALEIRKKQDLLRLRQDRYREDQESFCEDNLQALLRRSGRIEPEVPEPEVPEPDVDLSDMPIDTNPNAPVDWLPTAETEFQSSDDRPQDPDVANEASSDKYSAAERPLEREYIQVQDRLTQLQQEYGAKKYELQMIRNQHFIAFTNSNEASFEAFVESKLSSEAEVIGLTEQELVSLRQRLISAGREVPRSPNKASRSITGGGIRKRARTCSGSIQSHRPPPRPSPPRRDNRTGRLNRWRVAADDAIAKSDSYNSKP